MNRPRSSVPFSWENRPGVRKSGHEDAGGGGGGLAVKLRPPPCELTNRTAAFHEMGIPPPPPCAFQPPLRSGSRKDPFLMAYKECTKSDGTSAATWRGVSFGSCKRSCGVRDDSIVRVSQIPLASLGRKHSERVKYNG